MSLINEYSSGEEDESHPSTKDVFGISALPLPKKVRIHDEPAPAPVIITAPDVLAEVRGLTDESSLYFQRISSGPFESDFTGYTAHGHADECEHSI